MKTKLIGTAVIAMLVAVGCGKKKTPKETSRDGEKAEAESVGSGEQAAGSNHIKDIRALAKKSAEKDNNINFCGFFTGMSRYDAQDLAGYYKLKEDEYSFSALPGKAVSVLWFSPKGVRRMTDGGSTIAVLAQAVEKRVGGLEKSNGNWERRTIDGVVVTLNSEGLTIQNDSLASWNPIVTKRNVQREVNAQYVIRGISGTMVAIPGKNFRMGKYEVTQAQWEAVMGINPSGFKGADNPVENVSWDDCQKFLEKLNALPEVKESKSGLTYRLPTGKEWEYACRAGSTGDYCKLADGTEITESTLGEVAWYEANSGEKTHPVGRKKPNAFGLYDMHGNVDERCEDLYNDNSSYRVRHGGCYYSSSGCCTARIGFICGLDDRSRGLGFRLAASTKDVDREAGKGERQLKASRADSPAPKASGCPTSAARSLAK